MTNSWISHLREIKTTSLICAYLAIALPVMLAMSFLTEPLQSVDEPAHYLRTIQISNGDVLPVLAPDKKATGSLQTQAVAEFAHYFGFSYFEYLSSRRKASVKELEHLDSFKSSGAKATFAPHSNTTIYFPTVYIVPALAIKLSTIFTQRPLIWMYVGRVANALAASLLTACAIWLAKRRRALIVLIALLPISLFLEANLSADSMLIPCILLFAVVLERIASREPISPALGIILFASCTVICIGKIAYMPLVCLPALVAWIARGRFDRLVAACIAGAALLVAAWLGWLIAIRNLVLPMREDVGGDQIDVLGQVRLIMHHPTVFASALFHTLNLHQVGEYAYSFGGGIIGWLNIHVPHILTTVDLGALVLLTILDTKQVSFRRVISWLVALVVMSSASLIFLLLYLQWNNVGADKIEGVQGRYFLPLLPVLALLIPGANIFKRFSPLLEVAALVLGVVNAVTAAAYVYAKYWV